MLRPSKSRITTNHISAAIQELLLLFEVDHTLICSHSLLPFYPCKRGIGLPS